MGKTAYVIQSIGYEYNDEVNYVPDGGGGHAVAVYFDEVAAKKKLMELDIKEWRKTDIGRYGYGIDGVSDNVREFEKALEAVGVDSENWWDAEIPETATDEQIKNLIKYSSIRFYEIVQVVAEDYPEIPDSEIEPTSDMLDIQASINTQPKRKGGIFDSVDVFTNPNVEPTVVPDNVSIEDIKEAVAETNDSFLEIKEEMKRLRDEARKKVKDFFIKGMNKIFEMYPEVKSVSWRQYTDYFNDGEECKFRVYNDDFSVNGYSDYDDEGEDNTINVLHYDWEKGRKYTYHKGEEIKNAISGFLEQLDEDDYRTMFGDHVKIIVRKNEVTTEEYADHE